MQKILIVEDDLAIQALLHDFIQEAGYSVELASDGVEALSRFSEQNFDLVLLDIMLPKIDGYGVCEVMSLLLCSQLWMERKAKSKDWTCKPMTISQNRFLCLC